MRLSCDYDYETRTHTLISCEHSKFDDDTNSRARTHEIFKSTRKTHRFAFASHEHSSSLHQFHFHSIKVSKVPQLSPYSSLCFDQTLAHHTARYAVGKLVNFSSIIGIEWSNLLLADSSSFASWIFLLFSLELKWCFFCARIIEQRWNDIHSGEMEVFTREKIEISPENAYKTNFDDVLAYFTAFPSHCTTSSGVCCYLIVDRLIERNDDGNFFNFPLYKLFPSRFERARDVWVDFSASLLTSSLSLSLLTAVKSKPHENQNFSISFFRDILSTTSAFISLSPFAPLLQPKAIDVNKCRFTFIQQSIRFSISTVECVWVLFGGFKQIKIPIDFFAETPQPFVLIGANITSIECNLKKLPKHFTSEREKSEWKIQIEINRLDPDFHDFVFILFHHPPARPPQSSHYWWWWRLFCEKPREIENFTFTLFF